MFKVIKNWLFELFGWNERSVKEAQELVGKIHKSENLHVTKGGVIYRTLDDEDIAEMKVQARKLADERDRDDSNSGDNISTPHHNSPDYSHGHNYSGGSRDSSSRNDSDSSDSSSSYSSSSNSSYSSSSNSSYD